MVSPNNFLLSTSTLTEPIRLPTFVSMMKPKDNEFTKPMPDESFYCIFHSPNKYVTKSSKWEKSGNSRCFVSRPPIFLIIFLQWSNFMLNCSNLSSTGNRHPRTFRISASVVITSYLSYVRFSISELPLAFLPAGDFQKSPTLSGQRRVAHDKISKIN